jgi:hypothetical protein
LTLALKDICARPPIPQAVWYHQIHDAGGVSGSITIVMVFVRSCFLCGFFNLRGLILPYYKVNRCYFVPQIDHTHHCSNCWRMIRDWGGESELHPKRIIVVTKLEQPLN